MIYRGTTPTIKFKMPFKLDNLSLCYVSLSQNKKLLIDKDISDCTVDDTTISVTLSQAETLSLRSGRDVEVQIRWKLVDDKAFASEAFVDTVEAILKDGEI